MKVVFIGGGQMGSALLTSAVTSGALKSTDVLLLEKDETKSAELKKQLGILTQSAFNQSVSDFQADLYFLCVKPQDIATTLLPFSNLKNKTSLVSIAAGVKRETLKKSWTAGYVTRLMPNLAARVGASANAVCYDEALPAEHRSVIDKVLLSSGTVVSVAEKDFDAVTALSGSGPAYVFIMVEALADAGVRQGLSRENALALATQTVFGAAQLLKSTGTHPAVLKDQVASPGGTTIAGLEALEANGFRNALYQAVAKACARSKELG
jgi:pyrroline-5-carboxylate reductase